METLFIVSTPIGNLQDITIRAIKTLYGVDYILSENVQKTKFLLSELRKRYNTIVTEGNDPKILLCNEYTENKNIYQFVSLLEKGYDIALVSSAGTPLISDPGYKLVQYTLKKNLRVVSIPGPSAMISAFVVSGLPTDRLLFLGFLPKKLGNRKNVLYELHKSIHAFQKSTPTVVLYESPHRLRETLEILKEVFGNIDVVLARELTKKFEEILRDHLDNFIMKYNKVDPKGEYTIVFNIKTPL